MTEAIAESVMNISEGRRMAVIDAIAASIEAVKDVRLLHRTSDPDHNRTVLSFAGPPDRLIDAAFAAIVTAAEHIDMNEHDGVHPRLGAADVVPIIPIQGLTLEDCVGLAHKLGERIGRELRLPVYMYEAAATRDTRRNLADVRRGEYEGLKLRIGREPEAEPDYGPASLGTAGAVIIGARNALIAFNVFLTTEDVEVARAVAQAIRGSSGGLTGLKALGLLVGGRAQVSMNLVDYKRTPLHRVLELVRREAAQYGASIYRSELIGLIPRDALIDAALWYLQLDADAHSQILEDRIWPRS